MFNFQNTGLAPRLVEVNSPPTGAPRRVSANGSSTRRSTPIDRYLEPLRTSRRRQRRSGGH